MTATIGFIGLGVMGEPMALNLVRAGLPLLVWNCGPEKRDILKAAGAAVAENPRQVFRETDIVILMLADEAATDGVLARGTPDFAENVRERTIVQMGTTAPGYSKLLEADTRAAGGHYVEAPVSGSRKPAETGDLVAMLAGEPERVAEVRPLLSSMCRHIFTCGAVPNAMAMKLAVNLFLIPMVTGLAEAANFAERQGLDLNLLAAILDAGPMASPVSRVKMAKLAAGDFSVQAAVADALKNSRLSMAAARDTGIAAPLLEACETLYRKAVELGHGRDDMVAVIHAIAVRKP